MGSCQDSELRPCRLRGTDPLVGVQMDGIEYIVVLDRIDAVGSLPVYLTVKDMQVIMEHYPHLGLMPLDLVFCRDWYLRLSGAQGHSGTQSRQ